MFIYIVLNYNIITNTTEALSCWSSEVDAIMYCKKYPNSYIKKLRLNSEEIT